jgi:hypothetical protein
MLGVIKCKFKLLVYSQEAKAVPPLSSVIGQFGLNTSDFCNQFNEKSKEYGVGMPLLVTFFVLQERKFRFTIEKIAINKLIYFFAIERRKRAISILSLYRVYRLLVHLFPRVVKFRELISLVFSMRIREIRF